MESIIKWQFLKSANRDSVKEMGSLGKVRSQTIVESLCCRFPQAARYEGSGLPRKNSFKMLK